MTDVGDNDKTRLIKTNDQVSGEDDRTRFASPVAKPDVAASNEEKQLTPPQPVENAADKTRIISRESAALLSSAKAASQTSNQHESSDKTQFKPTIKNPNAIEATPAKNENLDKTRIASKVQGTSVNPSSVNPASVNKKATPELPIAGSDKTQFVNSNKAALAAQASDATKFVPREKPKAPQEVRAQETTGDSDASQEYPVLKNRFVFEELLGAGGMGSVYKAKDLLKVEAQDRDPYVAIKVLNDEFKTHPEAFIALQRESRKSQKIAHPNIVNVHDFDRDGDTVFMTMEYMEGKPLDRLISQYRSVGLPHEEVMKILEGISAALIYAHAQNIIHSDFKPGNIFVNSKGFAKVFDFGIARAVAKADHREETTDDKTVFDAGKLGALTPAYASYEMLEGLTPDTRDDIYALGCIAYELYTGMHPFNRVHANEAKRQKLKPKKIPGIPKYQWKAIERALAFERESRTPSVEVFWREMTKKQTHTGKILTVFLILLASAGGAYYKFKPAAQKAFSESEARTEIEKKLRLELKMKALTDLLMATKLTSAVEAQVWAQVQELRQLLGKGNLWITQEEVVIYDRYIKEIEHAIEEKDFATAQTLVTNAYRYAITPDKLKEFEVVIANAVEEKKRQELARQEQLELQQRQQKTVVQTSQPVTKETESVAQKNNAFQIALGSVNSQLECQSNIDMKDFDIAITQLKSLNSALYVKEEPRITSLFARCIEHIGSSFPDRALASKAVAMRIFNGHPTIAAITIAQKDPCSSSIAGLGSRGVGSSCKDKLNGASKAPAMVVIPAKGSIKTFAIGKYEVAVEELNEYCQQTKACEPNTTDENGFPATHASLAVAQGYTKWLSEKSNRKYRLPTMLEWQYAAKANGGRVDQNRNCKLNSRGIQKGNSLIKVTIGQQNEWGLVNYLGNARELVSDAENGALALGGSFETAMDDCDVNYKEKYSGQPDAITGFRILREVND